ncbi:MAG TPA: periplasmic heavy metal sensor [Stellaceae bacterium]|nr:periplasmic heavy metal sensor [Stellaceae bacterium]
MMLAEPAVHSATRQHWWKVLLALSLALNLFFVIGALWIHVHHRHPLVMAPADRLEQMASEIGLNPEQKVAFAHYSQTMRDRLQALHDAVQPLISAAWSEVAKTRADEAKVMQYFDQADAQRRSFTRDLTTRTLSFLATLSPEQRAKFVQIARHGPRPWSPPHDHDHDGDH